MRLIDRNDIFVEKCNGYIAALKRKSLQKGLTDFILWYNKDSKKKTTHFVQMRQYKIASIATYKQKMRKKIQKCILNIDYMLTHIDTITKWNCMPNHL